MSKLTAWLKSKLFTPEVKPMSEPVNAGAIGSSVVDGQVTDPTGVAPVSSNAYIATGGIAAVGDQPPAAPTQVITINAVEADLDAFAAKFKALLKVAGHDIEAIFPELVALAKKV